MNIPPSIATDWDWLNGNRHNQYVSKGPVDPDAVLSRTEAAAVEAVQVRYRPLMARVPFQTAQATARSSDRPISDEYSACNRIDVLATFPDWSTRRCERSLSCHSGGHVPVNPSTDSPPDYFAFQVTGPRAPPVLRRSVSAPTSSTRVPSCDFFSSPNCC